MSWKTLQPRTGFLGIHVGHRTIHISTRAYELVRGWGRVRIEYDPEKRRIRLSKDPEGYNITSHQTISAHRLTKIMPLGRYQIVEKGKDSLVLNQQTHEPTRLH